MRNILLRLIRELRAHVRSQSVGIGLILVVVNAASSTVSTAQGDSLSLGPAKLKLGMDLETVRSLVVPHFELKEQSPNSYAVSSKDGLPHRFVGSILFRDGRLFGIDRDWGNFQGADAVRLSKALLDLFDGSSSDDRFPASVFVHRMPPSPQMRGAMLVIQLEDRTIELMIYEPSSALREYRAQAGLSEKVGY